MEKSEMKKVELCPRDCDEKAVLFRIVESGEVRYYIRSENRHGGDVRLYFREQLPNGEYWFATARGGEYLIHADDTALSVFFDDDSK